MPRILHAEVAPDATALALLGTDYGLTLPVRIVFELGIKKMGDDWAPEVTAMTGEFCVQARILAHFAIFRLSGLNLELVINHGKKLVGPAIRLIGCWSPIFLESSRILSIQASEANTMKTAY
jgi:hypothetical protein